MPTIFFKCSVCKKEVESFNKLSSYNVRISMPQFNINNGNRQDNVVRTAMLEGICNNCVKKITDEFVEKSTEDDGKLNESKFFAYLFKYIYDNRNDETFYTERKL